MPALHDREPSTASPARASSPHCIKVNVSSAMRLRLHSHKIMTGISISEVIEEALEVYFRTHGAPAERQLPQDA